MYLNIFSEIAVKIDPDPNHEIVVLKEVELVQDHQAIEEIME